MQRREACCDRVMEGEGGQKLKGEIRRRVSGLGALSCLRHLSAVKFAERVLATINNTRHWGYE